MEDLILLTQLLLVLLLLLKMKNLVLVTQSKKHYKTKINEIEKKITDHDHINKYITTPEFNKLTSENFAVRLKQANVVSKSDIATIVNKTNFHKDLKDVSSNKNELKVKAILTKGLTKGLIYKFTIINGAKYTFWIYFKTIQYLCLLKIH